MEVLKEGQPATSSANFAASGPESGLRLGPGTNWLAPGASAVARFVVVSFLIDMVTPRPGFRRTRVHLRRERLLMTMVHISDLHFGDLGPNDDATLSAAVVDWWRVHPVFDGYLGHHGIALRHLADFMAEIGETSLPMLLVTGDLTANGGNAQFELVMKYLCNSITLSSGASVGLGMPEVATQIIPGNHDHWPGRTAVTMARLGICGNSTEGLKTLGLFPRSVRQVDLPNGNRLTLLGIDTDSDVPGGFPCVRRFFARGNFVTQLERLEEEIGSPHASEIRVLMLHHSPMHAGFVLGITQKSRIALEQFVQRCGISILLTGHMHEPGAQKRTVSYRGASWNVVEFRSGTATRRDELPLSWKPRTLTPNTLLVHRLYELDGNRVEWRTNFFQRFLEGFRDRGPLPISGGEAPFVVVWPRV